MGKSSSLPASISKIRTTFEKGEKNPKFAVGPTDSSPGPMLLRQDATAVKLVAKLTEFNEIRIDENTKTKI